MREPANEPMRIPSSQMDVYGLQPVREGLALAQCRLCRKTIRLAAFAGHLELCRRLAPPPPPPVAPPPSPSLPPTTASPAAPPMSTPTAGPAAAVPEQLVPRISIKLPLPQTNAAATPAIVNAAAPPVVTISAAASASSSVPPPQSVVAVAPSPSPSPSAVTNPAPVSSTRIGLGASAKNRAPPTPPKLMKLKKPKKRRNNDDFEDEGDLNDDDVGDDFEMDKELDEVEVGDPRMKAGAHPTTGRKTMPGSGSGAVGAAAAASAGGTGGVGAGAGAGGASAAGPPVPPMLSMRSSSSDAHGKSGTMRKGISVLEIRADNSDSNKVTIMVQSAAPVLTRAHRAGSAGGAAPLASRRWTRRNKLTGLSLSFKIRSDDCDSDDEEEEEDEDEDAYYEGGDLSQGWAYTTLRRRSGPLRTDTEDAALASGKRRAPAPAINNVSSKRFFGGSE